MVIKCEDKLFNCDEYLDVCFKYLYLLLELICDIDFIKFVYIINLMMKKYK